MPPLPLSPQLGWGFLCSPHPGMGDIKAARKGRELFGEGGVILAYFRHAEMDMAHNLISFSPGMQLKPLRKSRCNPGSPAKHKTRAVATGRSQLRGLVPAGQTSSVPVKPRLCGWSGGDPQAPHARGEHPGRQLSRGFWTAPEQRVDPFPCPRVMAWTGEVGMGLGIPRAWPVWRRREERSRGGGG